MRPACANNDSSPCEQTPMVRAGDEIKSHFWPSMHLTPLRFALLSPCWVSGLGVPHEYPENALLFCPQP